MRKYSTKKTKKTKRLQWRRMFLGASFRVFLILIILLFSIIYLVEASSLTTRGYKISKLNQKIDKLQQKNKRLRIKIAEKRSIRNVVKRIDEEKFVPAENVDYARLAGNTVVKK